MRVGQIANVISVEGSFVMRSEMAIRGISPGVRVKMLDPSTSPMLLNVDGVDITIGRAQGGKVRVAGI